MHSLPTKLFSEFLPHSQVKVIMGTKILNHCLHLDNDILISHGGILGSSFVSERVFKTMAINVPGAGTGMKV